MSSKPYLRFGGTPGKIPAAVVIALRGGSPQAVEPGWRDWLVQNFLEMSKLNFLATPDRVVLMPDIQLPLLDGIRVEAILNNLLADFAGAKRYIFAFSANGSSVAEEGCKRVRFDGVVIWSAVDIPQERNPKPRIPTRVVVVYGASEKCGRFGFRACRETAEDVANAFRRDGSDVVVWAHNETGSGLAGKLLPGHCWSPGFNQPLASRLEIPA